MQALEEIWSYWEGGVGVWQIEHLFGTDTFFGSEINGRLVPLRWVMTPSTPDGFIDRRRLRQAVIMLADGNWSGMMTVLADLGNRT